MVPLEERSNYLSYVDTNPKLAAFNDFLNGRKVLSPSANDLSEVDIIYYNVLSSIVGDDKHQFIEAYSQISKRKPSKDSTSPFVHDDFLIFALILGISKYDESKQWILGIIQLRKRTSTTITLENLINGNYESTSNSAEVVLAYLSILDFSTINQTLLNVAYTSIIENKELFESQSDLLILCALKAYDVIIEIKLAPPGSKIEALMDFERYFLRRVGHLSVILYNLILVLGLFGLSQLIHVLPQETKNRLNEIGIVVTIVGAGLIGGNLMSVWRNKFKSWVYSLFGYKSKKIG